MVRQSSVETARSCCASVAPLLRLQIFESYRLVQQEGFDSKSANRFFGVRCFGYKSEEEIVDYQVHAFVLENIKQRCTITESLNKIRFGKKV